MKYTSCTHGNASTFVPFSYLRPKSRPMDSTKADVAEQRMVDILVPKECESTNTFFPAVQTLT